MKRVAVVGLALLAFLAAAQTGVAKTGGGFTVVGLTSNGVSRVDPVTLERVGRSLALFEWFAAALSPDRRILAIGANNSGLVRFVDVRRMETLGDVHPAQLVAQQLVWLAPRLVVVDTGPQLIAVDARTRRVLWRTTVAGQVIQLARDGSGLVAVTGPADHIGQAQLVEIDANGQTRTVELATLAGSSWPDDPSSGLGDIRRPGLVVDPTRRHAYVFGAGEPVADVDLSSLAVAYHGGNRTLAKAFSGWDRQATWLGNGVVAVTGLDFQASVAADGAESQTMTPAGLTLVDTTTWTTKSVDPSVGEVVRSGGVLIATGSTYATGQGMAKGNGLSLLGLDGSPRVHLLGHALVLATTVVHGLAYTWADGRLVVTDPSAGNVLTNRAARVVEIL